MDDQTERLHRAICGPPAPREIVQRVMESWGPPPAQDLGAWASRPAPTRIVIEVHHIHHHLEVPRGDGDRRN